MKRKLLDEFKAFALKGNMADLAIGVVIGTAFNKVISSIVNDLILPPLGLLYGGVDFSDLTVPLKWPGSSKEPLLWNIGSFFNALIDFFIIAWAVFVVVKALNKLRGIKPQAEPENKTCTECHMSIPKEASKCAYCTSSQH